MGFLTTTHAKQIARKFKAKIEKKGSHDKAIIRYDGKYVTTVSIRRSSKEVGHGHLRDNLRITPRQVKELADCTISAEEYFEILKSRNEI